MNKITDKTLDLTKENIDKIAELFPQVVTEREGEDGVPTRSIDFDLLRQMLSDSLVEGTDERYRLDWPGKRASLLKANTPIAKTLRPDRASSVDFDTTENVFIEGDNFEALKILQESYLGKVKMIYIDPPYNTGKDFVYSDNFTQEKSEYEEEIKAVDEEGNKMFKENTRTNPRFHSDWLSMMYERLIIARDLLRDDGVIFISIDDNEVHNLRKVCDEIFGETNFVGAVTWSKKRKGSFLSKEMISVTEYGLVYVKSRPTKLYGGSPDASESQPIIKRTNSRKKLFFKSGVVETKLIDGSYKAGDYGTGSNLMILENDIEISEGRINSDFTLSGPFVWTQETLDSELNKDGARIVINTKNFQPRVFRIYSEEASKGLSSLFVGVEYSATNEDGYEEVRDLFGREGLFDYPKPVNYLKYLVNSGTYWDKESIILDFFSGSATTAHAVMTQNAEDGGSRKFIMVQLPEETPEGSEASKAGYKTIAEIGRERIRRAAAKIKTDYADKLAQRAIPLDTGFRPYTVTDTAFLDVERHPSELEQGQLLELAKNIKNDRTPEDLLTQVMLELGLTLDLPIEIKQIGANTVFYVAHNALVACFDESIPTSLIDEMAECQPLQVAFKDASFGSDDALINAETHLKRLSPDTILSVI